MLSEKPEKGKTFKENFFRCWLAVVLSLPSIFLSVAVTPANVSPGFSFADALWDFRALDVILQGLVIMTVALGIAIVLYERKAGES
jgi:multisubunit Na+/H+ antiporter MnhB subunit